jgi:hypothetical protein
MQLTKSLKRTILSSALGLLAMPALALANNLVIHNNTDFPSTTVINDGVCSNFLPGGVGITQPHSTNTVPSVTVHSACWADRENCRATIYITNDCTGPVIAKVVLSTKSGVKSIEMLGSYSIIANGFEVTLG